MERYFPYHIFNYLDRLGGINSKKLKQCNSYSDLSDQKPNSDILEQENTDLADNCDHH